MRNASLVILAAGFGSRFGGGKQIAAVGPNGEIMMDYAIFDALRAGFDKVVFIVSEDILPEIRERFDAPLRRRGAETAYVVQDFSSLPAWFIPPAGRTKPYGTAHALSCARALVHEPFAVINADDFYGAEAYGTLYKAITAMPEGQAAMVGYLLKNTVSRYGAVNRGVCAVENGLMRSVTETYQIAVMPDGSFRSTKTEPPGPALDPETIVSMTFFGFRPSFFAALEDYLNAFLRALPPEDLKGESPLPAVVDTCLQSGALTVPVLRTEARWFGMTYRADHPAVRRELQALHDAGAYPTRLWE